MKKRAKSGQSNIVRIPVMLEKSIDPNTCCALKRGGKICGKETEILFVERIGESQHLFGLCREHWEVEARS